MSTTLILFVLFATIFAIGALLGSKLKTRETFAETIMSALNIKNTMLKRTFCDKQKEIVDFLNGTGHDDDDDDESLPIKYNEKTKTYSINQSFCKS